MRFVCCLVLVLSFSSSVGAQEEQKTTATPAALKAEHPEIFTKLLDATNAERIKLGLRPMKMDPVCMKAASRWAGHMARTGSFYHSNFGRENIAMGQRSVSEVTRTWMNSSGHRANILSGATRLGVACYRGRNGSIYWVQCFR